MLRCLVSWVERILSWLLGGAQERPEPVRSNEGAAGTDSTQHYTEVLAAYRRYGEELLRYRVVRIATENGWSRSLLKERLGYEDVRRPILSLPEPVYGIPEDQFVGALARDLELPSVVKSIADVKEQLRKKMDALAIEKFESF